MSKKRKNKEQTDLRDLIINNPEAKMRIAIKKSQEKVDKLKYGKKESGVVLWQI